MTRVNHNTIVYQYRESTQCRCVVTGKHTTTHIQLYSVDQSEPQLRSPTVWDVVVSPAWQGYGIGKGIVERLIARLLSEDITNINLYAESKVVSLYESLDFVADPEGTTGMAFRQQRGAGNFRAKQRDFGGGR